MAAFSYQHMMTPFLIDSSSAPLQNMPKNLNFHSGGLVEVVEDHEGFIGKTNFFPSYNESSKTSLSVADDSMTKEKLLLQSNNNVTDQSSTVVDELEIPMDNKRKNSGGSSLDSAQPKSGREARSKRQKRGNGEVKEEESKGKPEKKDQTKVHDLEPPTGYIHVRARRGQATDSHSLAERVRREKISEKMKTLQRLVPGCDKVNGKALMLDEIIHYVQSLQNQVEFLSMKLASVNPLLYEFGMDLDAFMVLPERPSNVELSPSLSPMQQFSTIQSTTFVDANTTTTVSATVPAAVTFATAMNYPLMDSSLSLLLQGQRPIDFTQDSASMFWDLEEQRQKFHNPPWVNNNFELYHYEQTGNWVRVKSQAKIPEKIKGRTKHRKSEQRFHVLGFLQKFSNFQSIVQVQLIL